MCYQDPPCLRKPEHQLQEENVLNGTTKQKAKEYKRLTGILFSMEAPKWRNILDLCSLIFSQNDITSVVRYSKRAQKVEKKVFFDLFIYMLVF